jgi:signal transduction histidine kinase
MERMRRFTADAAHELRTPLTAMIGEAEVTLRKERSAEALRQSLEAVHEDAERLARLVDALLLLARADAGTLLARSGEVELGDVARDAVARAKRLQTQKEIHAELVAEPLPLSRGDADLLGRAVGNLLDNALRHARSRVELSVGMEGAAAVIRVSDDGAGVPPGVEDEIFARFFRADASRTGEGTGLGLAITRAIAEAYGGKLSLESALPATFRLELPLAGERHAQAS